MFGAKCDKCHHYFDKNDYVMRAKNKIFHLDCFRCNACEKPLVPGEEFALKLDGSIFCKEDHKSGVGVTSPPPLPPPPPSSASTGREENNNKKEDDVDSRYGSKSAEDEEDGDEGEFQLDDALEATSGGDGGGSDEGTYSYNKTHGDLPPSGGRSLDPVCRRAAAERCQTRPADASNFV